MDFTTYEYGVDKKREGSLKLLANLLILLYIVFAVGMFGILYWIRLIPVGALIPLFLWMLIFFTWRYVQVDDAYYIESGTLTLVRKYGNRSKKTLTEFRIKDAELIAPLADSAGAVRDFAAEREIDARPSMDAADVYVILYRDKSGKRTALYIQVTAAALKSLRYYNEKTVVTKTAV